MARFPQERLLRVSKAKKYEIDLWKEGLDLHSTSKIHPVQLARTASLDRLALAARLSKQTRRLIRSSPPLFRAAVSRGYYSIYHAIRAVTFYSFGGDDHEEHTKLPSHLPHDFPARDIWVERAKQARLERNRADYDPYPILEAQFEHKANEVASWARELIPLSRSYLKAKGCI